MDNEHNIVAQAIARAGSQVKLAAALRVTQQSVSRWLKSKRIPSRHAAKVATLYGFDVLSLLGN